MSRLTDGANALTGEIVITKQTGTLLTLATDETYVDKDIQFTIGAQGGTASSSASADADVESTSGSAGGTNISGVIGQKATTEPSSGYYIRVKATGTGASEVTSAGWMNTGSQGSASAEAVKYFPVDAATATVSGTNTVTPVASVSGNNITLSNTNNGISVTATGGGTASATASATGNQAGYVPANGQIGTGTIAAPNQTTSASSYISGVTLGIPASGTNSFSVTLPNGGNDTLTLTFTVDANGNWSIE